MNMFRYDWSRFDAKLGLIFMIGTLVVFSLAGKFEVSMYASGISALLAWLTIILVPQRRWSHHLLGLVAYLVLGIALTWLAYILSPYMWGRLISMAIVTFVGYMMLLRGPHPYMVAWCLVYWYLLLPLLLSGKELSSVLLGHVAGACLVITLNLMKPIWMHATQKALQEVELSESPAPPPTGLVVRYAFIVSISVVTGLAAGMRWIISDPTIVANATLNMISPSLQQTWHDAMERIILGALGIVGGFYFGWFFPDQLVGYLVVFISSFLALGVIYVNMALLVGIIFFLMSYFWGVMQSDQAHIIANEKLIGELVGVGIAVIAIVILEKLQRNKKHQ